jgi:hypothetical protein
MNQRSDKVAYSLTIDPTVVCQQKQNKQQPFFHQPTTICFHLLWPVKIYTVLKVAMNLVFSILDVFGNCLSFLIYPKRQHHGMMVQQKKKKREESTDDSFFFF